MHFSPTPRSTILTSASMWMTLGTILFIIFQGAAWAAPQFKDLPATQENGPTSPLKWAKELLLFQARIVKAAKQPANFAGHYVLTQWGCGTSCVTGVVIDKLNGQIIPFPFSICCATPKSASFKPVEFRPTSRLVIFAGLRNEEEPMGAHYYEFTGTGFKYITTVPDDGSFSGGPSPNQESASTKSARGVSNEKEAIDIPIRLTRGMLYVEARKALIGSGWQAPNLPANGYDEKSKKVIEECSGDVAMCNNFPEITSCSGQGYCLMEFTNKSNGKLEVTTYGELSGNDPDAKVTDWQRKPPH